MTKRTDGGAVLSCRRPDGSVTWQRHQGRHAAFFPLHDLTHYAVESALAIGDAFYGLIADGWSIEQTTGKSDRGPLSANAIYVEYLVGQFDLERASGREWSADEVNRHAVAHFAGRGDRPAPRSVSDEQLSRIRDRLAALLDRWVALAPGQTLELRFEPTPTST